MRIRNAKLSICPPQIFLWPPNILETFTYQYQNIHSKVAYFLLDVLILTKIA